MLSQKDALRFYAFITMRKFTIDNCVHIAYTDVCRTLNGFAKNDNKDQLKTDATESIRTFVKDTLTNSYTQATFDKAHKAECDRLMEIFRTGFPITYGQAQKWINMSLKYVYYLYLSGLDDFVIPEDQIEKLKLNYKFFHIPIDEVVLKDTKVKRIIKFIRERGCWSKWEDYEAYSRCQRLLREKVDMPLLDFENGIWNNHAPE